MRNGASPKAFDPSSGQSLYQILEAQGKPAAKITQSIGLLCLLKQNETLGEASEAYAIRAALRKEDWISEESLRQAENRARYVELLKVPSTGYGLPLEVTELEGLADLLQVRIVYQGKGLGVNESPVLTLEDASNKEAVLAEILARTKALSEEHATRLEKFDVEFLRESLGHWMGMQYASFSDRLKLALKSQTERLLPLSEKIARQRELKDSLETRLDKHIQFRKEAYESTRELREEQLEKEYNAELKRIEAQLERLEQEFAKAKQQINSTIEREKQAAVRAAHENYRTNKRKIYQGIGIAVVAAVVTCGAGSAIVGVLGVKSAVGAAAINAGVYTTVDCALNQDINPKRIAKTFAVAMAGAYAADYIKGLGTAGDVGSKAGQAVTAGVNASANTSQFLGSQAFQQFAKAASQSLISSAIESDFSNALQRAVLAGAIQNVGEKFANAVSGKSELIKAAAMGVTSTALHGVSESILTGQPIDWSQSVVAGMQSVLTYKAME